MAFDRSTIRYQSRRASDTSLRSRIKALAVERRRFGYRRIHVLLKRDGIQVTYHLDALHGDTVCAPVPPEIP